MPGGRAKSGAVARLYRVRGRVQGVGFRFFAVRVAEQIGVKGYVRNLDDGSVEVYAIGTPEQLSDLSGYLWHGPRLADVRGVEEQEAALGRYDSFVMEY